MALSERGIDTPTVSLRALLTGTKPALSGTTRVTLADYVRRQGWRVRTFGGTHGFLDGPAEFEALVRHPVVGPAPLRP